MGNVGGKPRRRRFSLTSGKGIRVPNLRGKDVKSGGNVEEKEKEKEREQVEIVEEKEEGEKEVVVVEEKKYEASSEMDKRIIDALIEIHKKKQEENAGKKKAASSLNKVVLNFPRIQQTFSGLRRVFEDADTDGNGSLDHGELGTIMEKLNTKLTDEEVKQIFQEADVYADGQINFKEFLTCLAVGFVLKLIPELKDKTTQSMRNVKVEEFLVDSKNAAKSFQLATEMYLTFDTTCSGTISMQDMETAFSDVNQSDARNGKRSANNNNNPMTDMLTSERWKELDWDDDGHITYQEFIYTFVQWVSSLGGDDEDEEDDDDNDVAAAADIEKPQKE